MPCVGVLSAIAIPQFISYLARAKTEEARANLRTLATLADGYYELEHWAGAANGMSGCAVGSGSTSNEIGPHKTVLPSPLGDPFDALGFSLLDPVYYRYEIDGAGGCGHAPGTPVYTFRAVGDLDGDGVTSRFEITATAAPGGRLERSPLRVLDETE